MRTTVKLVTALVLTVAPIVGAVGPARAGGGGCHAGVTQGEGSTIRIIDACFTPTILHVAPGDTVTWINDDAFAHNITANGWGHFDDLAPHDRFAATFDHDGLYPFACTIHPGMSGVLVVGSGAGPGNGTAVEVAPMDLPIPPASVTNDPTATSGGWIAAAAVGVLLGVAGGLGLAEVRRRATGARPMPRP
jgi:plastocyanin